MVTANPVRGRRLAIAGLLLGLSGCSPPARFESPISAAAGSSQQETRIELIAASCDVPSSFVALPLTPQDLAAIGRLDPEQRAALFQVYVDSELAAPPAVLGSMSIERNSLRFTPRFELEPGRRYQAVFDRTNLPAGGQLAAEFQIPPAAAEPPTRVAQIYPSGDRLPENQLKFYLHFSAPMSRGQAYQHIHLLDANGQELECAFLELAEELWDRDMRRFTLLCDPGRVKQGLKPREELGPVLEHDKNYRLVVDRDWRDARGSPLAASAEKSFHVLPPDTTPIDTTTWKIKPPPVGSLDAVVVQFPESLDHSLLERVVWITGLQGNKLAGSIEVDDCETRWRFTPDRPWGAGDYQIVAATTLEDLAGNSIGRAFEVDASRPVVQAKQADTVSVPFSVVPADGPLRE